MRTVKVSSLEDGLSQHWQDAEDSGSVCMLHACVMHLSISPERVLVPKSSW